MKAVDALILTGLATVLLVTSLLVLPSYGITWDEGLGDLFFGHRNLQALVTGDASALEFATRHVVDGDGVRHPDLFLSPLRTRPWEHWPVMASLSAALCQLLARRLALLDPVDAHHLAGAVVVMVLLPLFYFTAKQAWGRLGAATATTLLLLHPRLLAAVWTDLKDTGIAVWVTATLLLAWLCLTKNQPLPALLTAITIGLGLGTKANILFVPVPLVVFALVSWPALPTLARTTRLAIAVVAPLSVLMLWLEWPWLRADPVSHLRQNLMYVAERATAGDGWPNLWPGLTVLASWPLGSLLLVTIGAGCGVASLRRRDGRLEGLALLATVFPLARLCAPGVVSFDGFRHGLELVPAATLLAGAGVAWLMRVAPGRRAQLLVALCLLEPVAEVASVHPNEVAHFSPLVGGPAGAISLGFPQVEDYWASSYRRAYAWVSTHAEPDALIAAGVAEHLLYIEGPLRLRPDLHLIRASSPFRPDPGAAVKQAFFAAAQANFIYLIYIRRSGWSNPIIVAADVLPAVWSDGPHGVQLTRIVRFQALENLPVVAP